MDPIRTLRQLIAHDQLDEALQQLRTLLEKSPQLDEVLQQSARLHDIHRQIRLGTVSHADAALAKNQIRAGLLDFISEMEETTARPDAAALREEVERATITIHQHADKIYNIDKIDNANFS